METIAEEWFKIFQAEDRKREFWERCIYSDNTRFVIIVLWEKGDTYITSHI